jgi:hypothetical protein
VGAAAAAGVKMRGENLNRPARADEKKISLAWPSFLFGAAAAGMQMLLTDIKKVSALLHVLYTYFV